MFSLHLHSFYYTILVHINKRVSLILRKFLMYTYKDKMNIIASFNAKHKTCYQYDVKTDTVVEEFNRKSFPQAFDRWADTILVKSV
jgi:hypothetical protein